MANQEQALPQQEMFKNPYPFTHAKWVGFNLEDVILNTKNEVALLYSKHLNKEEYLSEFWYSVNALDNSKVSFLIPTSGIYGVLGVNTFRKEIGKYYLSHSSDYMDLPSIDIVRPWFSTISEGLETVLTQPTIEKGANSISRQVEEDEASRTFKLEDLAKLVSSVQPSFKDLDSLEDDPIIVVDDGDEDEEADEVHATTNVETKYTSIPKSSSLRASQIQEPTNQVLILQSQKHKLEIEKNKAKDQTALLKAQPSFPNDLPTKFNELTEEAKLKTLNALPSLLNKVTNTLNQFAQAIASKKTGDISVPSAGPVGTQPAEGEKNTIQATISYLPKGFSQPEGEHIKKDKGKKVMSSKEAENESTNSDSNDDDETHVTGFMVKPSNIKKLKKFDFITKNGRHIHLTEEEINHQKKLEEDTKAKQPNKKGKENGTSEVIPNFKASDLHLELGINLDISLSEQDPLDKLNDLSNKKRKHANDIHDYFKANKRLKSLIQHEDHLPSIVLNEPVLGLGLDDHAKTFSSLLHAE
nr:hypothetical protein [Tanacetum cinerariifolium]